MSKIDLVIRMRCYEIIQSSNNNTTNDFYIINETIDTNLIFYEVELAESEYYQLKSNDILTKEVLKIIDFQSGVTISTNSFIKRTDTTYYVDFYTTRGQYRKHVLKGILDS